MISLTAAPATETLVEAIHPDAPNGASVLVRLRLGALEEVASGVLIEVLEAVRIEAVRIAITSAADRCSHPRNRGCRSRRSPMT